MWEFVSLDIDQRELDLLNERLIGLQDLDAGTHAARHRPAGITSAGRQARRPHGQPQAALNGAPEVCPVPLDISSALFVTCGALKRPLEAHLAR